MKIGIVGGTGYTGVELLRLLASHPEVEVSIITSRAEAGRAVADLFPNLRGHVPLIFSKPSVESLRHCDLIFFATPNGTAMKMAAELLDADTRVIDLSADFRLQDIAVWEQWYGMTHAAPELVPEAVYGLPEMNRTTVKTTRLLANPGCYPTATILGFLPLIKAGLASPEWLIADCKSGVSGAGRSASIGTLMGECGESFKAYAVPGHRHLPEISEVLTGVAGKALNLTFVPHLVPMIRGIHATLYARVSQQVDLQDLYAQYYQNEPFVDLLPAGTHPETRNVRSVNQCQIAVHRPQGGEHVVILSVIDNLVKGAAGQAIQNMNLMLGFEESMGLAAIGLLP